MELFVLLWSILFGAKEKPELSALEAASRAGKTESEANRILSGIYQRIEMASDRGEYCIEAALGINLDDDIGKLIRIKLEDKGYITFPGIYKNGYELSNVIEQFYHGLLTGWITISWKHLSK